MISARDVLAKVTLTADEETNTQRLDAILLAAMRRHIDAPDYAGQGFEITLETKASLKEILSLKRRCEASGGTGGCWRVRACATTDAYGESDGYVLSFDLAGHPPLPESAKPVSASVDVRGELMRLLSGASLPGFALAAKPVLSILTGTFNRRPMLQRMIESVRASVGDLSYEICVCDGGSTDGSREWLASQPDVVLVGARHLDGAVVAFNQAFAVARGEFIANLNDDAIVHGAALHDGVAHLRKNPTTGQVAFAFSGPAQKTRGINDIYPRRDYPTVTWATTYANFGIVRRTVADKIAFIQGGFWNPVYRTYAADCEFSAWCLKLGHAVDKLPHLYVEDVWAEDDLRKGNASGSANEAKRMYLRWPADAFRPDGREPNVSAEELARYRAVRDGGNAVVAEVAKSDILIESVKMIGWPSPDRERRLREIAKRIRPLDPVEGQFPKRAERLSIDRVLHVHLGTDADPQDGLVRALRSMGELDECGIPRYRQIRWPDFTHDQLQRKIIASAANRTLIFMQLQADGIVDVETVRRVREIVTSSAIIVGWCGDVAAENSPFNVDWQVPLARECDLWLHSSMSHVLALRAAGAHNAGFLNIGFDEQQYHTAGEREIIDGAMHNIERDFAVSFLGSRYHHDTFSASMKWHAAELRDDLVAKMREAFGERFGLFGNGWGDGIKPIPLAESHTAYWRSHMGLNASLANYLDCYSSDRIFRILGCGAVLLTMRFPGMSTLGLVHGENCLVFDDADDAVNKAMSYMACVDSNGKINGKPPSAIAEAGAKLAREHHTWNVRALELSAYIDAVRAK